MSALRLLADGRWRLTLVEREMDGVLTGWFAHPWLCLVRFRLSRYRWRTVVVPGWEVDADVHRRLRVALRAGDGAPSASQA